MTESEIEQPIAHPSVTIIKTVLHTATSLGSGAIVYALIRNNVVPKNVIQKITVPVASYAIGGLVADAASNHMDAIVDDAVEKIEKLKAKLNEVKTETDNPTE